MPVERRGQVTRVDSGQRATGGTRHIGGRRQPSVGGTSRISREAYVRICEGLGVQFPGPTRLLEECGVSRAFAVTDRLQAQASFLTARDGRRRVPANGSGPPTIRPDRYSPTPTTYRAGHQPVFVPCVRDLQECVLPLALLHLPLWQARRRGTDK